MKAVMKMEWLGTIRPNLGMIGLMLLLFAVISGSSLWIEVYQIFPLLFAMVLMEILSVSENKKNGADISEQILFSLKDRLLGNWMPACIFALIGLLIALAVFTDAGLAFSTWCILMIFPAITIPIRILVPEHEKVKAAVYVTAAVISLYIAMIFSLIAERMSLHEMFLEAAPENPYRFCWLAVPVTISFICSVVIADRLESVKK